MTASHANFSLLLLTAALASGCTGPGLLGNDPASAGDKPEHIEDAVRADLQRRLKDPYSVQSLEFGFERLSSCAIGVYGRYHGWLVPVRYNAKNSYGGYVGIREHYYWFHGENIVGVSSSPSLCPEAGGWRK